MSAALHDLTEINRKLALRVDDVVKRFFGNATAQGDKYWRMGDKHGAPGMSLAIWRTGAKKGEWCDFQSGEGGQMLSLVINAFEGKTGEAIRWAAQYVDEDARSETPEERARREKRDTLLREKKERERAANIAKMRALSKGLFLQGVPVLNTPADRYLLGRAIDLRRLPRVPGSLRFHPQVKFPDDGLMRPCLLAAVVDAQAWLTCHRHFLECLPDGRVVKADHPDVPAHRRVTDPKRAYSSWDGGIIPLWRGAGPSWREIKNPEAAIGTEGIEDGLSVALAMPDMRIGCSVTLGNAGKMWLPQAIDRLFWHRHRDEKREAITSYIHSRAQLNARGIDVADVFAPGEHKDFNEGLMAKAGLLPPAPQQERQRA